MSLQTTKTSGLDVLELSRAIVAPETVNLDDPRRRFSGLFDQHGEYVSRAVLRRRYGEITLQPPDVDAVLHQSEFIDKDAVYCGSFNPHFGHFLLETVARLWWGVETNFQGIYVWSSSDGSQIPKFAGDFFDALGLSNRVRLCDQPTQFRHVVVPDPAFEIGLRSHPEFLAIFRKVRKAALASRPKCGPSKIYLSRTNLEFGQIVGEDTLEDVFQRNGYVSASPEKLPLADQIALVSDAQEIAGIVGSALHLLVFTSGRSLTGITKAPAVDPAFHMIDGLTGTSGTYMIGVDKETCFRGRGQYGIKTPTWLEIDTVLNTLSQLGFNVYDVDARPFDARAAEFDRLFYGNIERYMALALEMPDSMPRRDTVNFVQRLISNVFKTETPPEPHLFDALRFCRRLDELGFHTEATSLAEGWRLSNMARS